MIVLVLGGARSGKSAVAETLAAGMANGGVVNGGVVNGGVVNGGVVNGATVTVLATAVVTDDDMAARVAAHRERRPPGWATVEPGPDLAGALRSVEGTVLVDALGTWLAQLPDLTADAAGLCSALVDRRGDAVVVSEEVGLGVHPSSEAGRRFRDGLGSLNQAVAAISDEVLLVVAGRAMRLAPAEPLVGEVIRP